MKIHDDLISTLLVMLGDTVPLAPTLFEYGVDAVSGTRVVDTDLALRCVSQGRTSDRSRG
jgi:uncharacterized protein (DUF4213/DUF364 family)